MVTIQSIMNADLDSSTTEWIEAQLSAGALGVKTPTGEMKWNRLREGLQGVVHRLASEVRWDQGRREGVGGGGGSPLGLWRYFEELGDAGRFPQSYESNSKTLTPYKFDADRIG